MGNQSYQPKRSQTKEYYQKSGNIHVAEFGGLMANYQWWPTPPQNIGINEHTLTGRWFCDHNGIPRNGDWCKIGDLSARRQDLFGDVYFHYLSPENK